MSPKERVERLRAGLAASTRRLEWATAEANENGKPPAITRLIEESREESLRLAEELGELMIGEIAHC
jgi:hypothetical protein